jgi:hypothetical protein
MVSHDHFNNEDTLILTMLTDFTTEEPSNNNGTTVGIRVTGISSASDMTIAVGDWDIAGGFSRPTNASNTNRTVHSSNESVAKVGEWVM